MSRAIHSHRRLHEIFISRASISLSSLAAAPTCPDQPENRYFDQGDCPERLHHEAVGKIWSLASRKPNLDGILEELRSDIDCGRIRISERLVLDVLDKFGVDWMPALGFFRWAGAGGGYRHTASAYNKMVDVLGRAKQFNRMRALVREMRRGGLFDVETYTKVVRRLVGGGRWEEAIGTFDGLEDLGIEKDTETLNILLGTLCKKRKVEVAHEALQYYLADVPTDAHTLNILVHGWCVIGRTNMAEQVVAEMKERGILPSVITYSTILQAHCRMHNFHSAFELMDKMVDKGCPPNTVTYTSVINSLAASGNMDAIFEVVNRMKLDGCKPDVFFYNSLISILGRAQRLDEASYVFEVEMPAKGVSPDLSTYNTLISVLCRHDQGQMALNVLNKVESSPWKPNIHTFNPLLKLCIRMGDSDDVLYGLLDDMVNKHQLSLDSTTYDLLIRGLCRVGKHEAAFLIFEGMMSKGILPTDLYIYDFLIAEAERYGLSDIVVWLRTFKHKFKELRLKK